MCNSGGWGCRNRGTACACNTHWGKCVPQYGATCTSHVCNVQTGGIKSKNRPISKWTDDPITDTTPIRLVHLTEMRDALNAELQARGLPQKTWENPGISFSSTQWTQIKQAIDECRNYDKDTQYYDQSTTMRSTAVATTFTFSETYEVGKTISTLGTQQLRQYLNALQATCVCDCNYNCSCNCNYCTCDCNYCYCNANWQCTCQCNYSDERLKENIEDLDSISVEAA